MLKPHQLTFWMLSRFASALQSCWPKGVPASEATNREKLVTLFPLSEHTSSMEAALTCP